METGVVWFRLPWPAAFALHFALHFDPPHPCPSVRLSPHRTHMPKYVVRYGAMRSLGVLTVRGKDRRYRRGDRVIARTKRGLEVGEVLCEAQADALATAKDMEQGEILREMSSNDANELAHIEQQTGKEFETCREHVRRLGLEMDLVDIEHVFGGERIVVYYLSEGRVDFRELVRQLAREFQTRIEMRQIGVRDEAKLLADYGDCGKPVCCNTHLKSMPPVSMKMAKLQKATLDPTKISGRCGRLKCCLRYEYDMYVEMQRALPAVGAEIVTVNGKAKVLAHEILASQLLVETEENRRVLIPASDVLSIIRQPTGKRKQRPRKNAHADHDKSRSSSRGKATQGEGRDVSSSAAKRKTRKRDKPSGDKPGRNSPGEGHD